MNTRFSDQENRFNSLEYRLTSMETRMTMMWVATIGTIIGGVIALFLRG